MAAFPTIQLSDFCHLFDVPDRQVRYVLEEGHVPQGVAASPSTGTRREFGPGQAFWLAIVLKLKLVGLKTALAVEVANCANRMLRAVTQNLSWDWTFLPDQGWFDTDHAYFLDVGDLEYVRLVTDANPSQAGLHELEWSLIAKRGTVIKSIRPFVILRIDLAQIARVLAEVRAWPKNPNRP